MTERVRIDLPVLLPDATGPADQCASRLATILAAARGVDQVHLARAEHDAGRGMVCVHFDPLVTTVARIRELATAAGAELTERFGHVVWNVTGVANARRARFVAERLRAEPGVADADVTPGVVHVEFHRDQVSEQRVRDLLADMDVAESQVPQHDRDHGHDHRHGGPFGERSELIAACVAAALWLVGFVLHHTHAVGDGALRWVFVAAGVFGALYTTREAIDGIRHRRFEIDFLMLVAAAGAWAMGKWEEGALLLALFSLGHALEAHAMGRAHKAIEALAALAPDTAVVRRADGERVIPIGEVVVGDLVVIKPNERVPADGFVVAGTSAVNQAPLTGESMPVDKQAVADVTRATAEPQAVSAESRLFAGTINGSGQLDMQVTRAGGESAMSRMAEMVRQAQTQTSPTQRFTDRFERVFVPAVLALVIGVLVVGWMIGGDFGDAFYRSMAVLVAASPCALAIATPSAVLAAIARAGQIGVLVKGGGPLEHLGRVTAIAFDKTGTLTEGRPQLTDVQPAGGVDPEELLSVAVAVEQLSDHPLAAAVVRDGTARLAGVAIPTAVDVQAVTGQGVRGVIDGVEVRIGNAAMFDTSGVDEPIAHQAGLLTSAGRTVMIVRHGRRFLGVLGLADTPRPGVRAVIDELRAVGVRRMVMLSGDHDQVARAIAAGVGVDEAWGDLMPEDKVTAVGRLMTEEGSVAMVGDGVNDAPALAHATVGIAMGAVGSDVALETADVALMGDDLARLPVVVGLGRRASRIIRQNLFASLGMVAVLIPATLAGVVGIGPAVILHEGSTLLVVANALRLLGYRRDLSR